LFRQTPAGTKENPAPYTTMLCNTMQHGFVQGQAGEYPGTALFFPGTTVLQLADGMWI